MLQSKICCKNNKMMFRMNLTKNDFQPNHNNNMKKEQAMLYSKKNRIQQT